MGSISSLNNAERTPTALFSSAIAECWLLYRNLPLFLNHRVIASRIKLSSVIARRRFRDEGLCRGLHCCRHPLGCGRHIERWTLRRRGSKRGRKLDTEVKVVWPRDRSPACRDQAVRF